MIKSPEANCRLGNVTASVFIQQVGNETHGFQASDGRTGVLLRI